MYESHQITPLRRVSRGPCEEVHSLLIQTSGQRSYVGAELSKVKDYFLFQACTMPLSQHQMSKFVLLVAIITC